MMQAIQSFDASVLLYIQDYLRTPVWNAFFVFFSRSPSEKYARTGTDAGAPAPRKSRKPSYHSEPETDAKRENAAVFHAA